MTHRNLVTGGAGFVGKALVSALRARGEYVRSFDLAAPCHADDIRGSILDGEALSRALAGIDSVFHLAGNAQLWSSDPGLFDRINWQGTQIVIDAAIQAGVTKFVHCSSLTTLVGRSTPIGPSTADETIRLSVDDMLGPYPRSKLLAEHLVERVAADDIDGIIVLPTEPIGPGDEAMTPPTQMICDFAAERTPAYIDCILNFVPVLSLAEGMIAARNNGRSGERYLLGGANTSMTDLLTLIGRLSNAKTPRTKMPYWVALAAGAIDTKVVSLLTNKSPKAPLTGVRLAGRQVSFSSEKASSELSWAATPFEPALEAMLAWLRDTGRLQSR
ncbi:MAG: NAD-dependent epimerase/dehydratase family protein [Pseudomonadota bacterium]